MSINLEPQQAKMYDMNTIAKAALVACSANQPVKITGESGCGKSDVVKQLTKRLGYKLFDLRVSDKEPSDIGGIPYPIMNDGHGKVVWLVSSDMLPFRDDDVRLMANGDESVTGEAERKAWNEQKCILFLDEFDRSSNIDVQNMALQILLDRQVNGHRLVEGCRIIVATNGTADVGTMPLTEAAAKRMIHLYVDVEADGTRESWTKWASEEGITPALIAYAKSFPDEFHGSKGHKFTEEQKPCARTNCMAAAVWEESRKIPWADSVIVPLIEGCVGHVAAANMVGMFRMYADLPKIEDIIADPHGCSLPDASKGFGLFFALGMNLRTEGKIGGVEDHGRVQSFATYVSRWPEEQQAMWFKVVSEDLPSVVSTREYKAWDKTYRV